MIVPDNWAIGAAGRVDLRRLATKMNLGYRHADNGKRSYAKA
jgi:hypothetical protein